MDFMIYFNSNRKIYIIFLTRSQYVTSMSLQYSLTFRGFFRFLYFFFFLSFTEVQITDIW